MRKCDFCNQWKDEKELIFLYHKQKYICVECEKKNKVKEKDEYLEYMYSTNKF